MKPIFRGCYGSRVVIHRDHYRLLCDGLVLAAGSLQLCLDAANEFGYGLKANPIGFAAAMRLSQNQRDEIMTAIMKNKTAGA